MSWSKMITVVALVWGNNALAALSPDVDVARGDTLVRITNLLEHFAEKHPELNVQVRDRFANYKYNETVARRVLGDLDHLDVIEDQHQPDPPAGTLKTLTCARALCYKEGDEEAQVQGEFRIACKRPNCQ